MRDPVDNNIAFLDRKHRSPVSLTHSIYAAFADKLNHVRVATMRCVSDFLQPIQQPSRLRSGHGGELPEDCRWKKQRHNLCSLIASMQVKRNFRLRHDPMG